jgi:uroporphyrinogen decarboxylase
MGEMNYWPETLERWRAEGMDAEPDLFFGYDYNRDWPLVSQELLPSVPEKVLEETDGYRLVRRNDGALIRERTDGESIPQWLEYPLKTRKDWEERFLPRLDGTLPERYPEDWETLVEGWRNRDTPLGLRLGSIYGYLRNWMGVQAISLAVYDDPAWVKEMMDHMGEFACRCGERALTDLDLDYVLTWEDMAGKSGPLLSPTMAADMMMGPYKRLTGFIRDHGVDLIFLDSDGMVDPLIPVWLESGVTGLYPLERAAGMDAVAVRQKYGKQLRLMGGVDKRAMAVGGAVLEAEVARIVPLLHEGGYVAWCDHFVPPDVSLANYLDYVRLVREAAQG